MAIFKALTFDGVNSLDYGIYITGEAVYNAPERAVEMVNIPGKNGALALDQGRFENIEVTYHAGCFADNQADFADKVMKFRNALASRYTYKRLTDEYHSDEYRLGLYKSGLEVDAVRYSTAGEFNITFDCKPQRFLVDGDRAISPTDWSDVQTESGELVTIESDGSLAVKSLEVYLEPIQDLNGYDAPWVGGAGKNLLPLPYTNTGGTTNGITYSVSSDGKITISNTATATAWVKLYGGFTSDSASIKKPVPSWIEADKTYILSGGQSANVRLQINFYQGSTSLAEYKDEGSGVSFTPTSTLISNADTMAVFLRIANGTTASGTISPMIRLSSTSATWTPYSNICPISGRAEVKTIVSPTTSATDGQTYTTSLGRTVYGGTLDVVSGVLTVDRVKETYEWSNGTGATALGDYTRKVFKTTYASVRQYSGDNIQKCDCLPWKHNYSEQSAHFYVDTGNAGSNNCVVFMPNSVTSQTLNIVYGLATPQTYQLTPQQIDLLLGANHLWSDGEITVEYGVHPYYNPTPFASKPLIKVTGTGTLGIGEYILTITGTASQTLYIDCETMEIYTIEGTVPTGASSLVSINKNDFPVLEPGTNYISVGSGITAVTITPRWWRI